MSLVPEVCVHLEGRHGYHVAAPDRSGHNARVLRRCNYELYTPASAYSPFPSCRIVLSGLFSVVRMGYAAPVLEKVSL